LPKIKKIKLRKLAARSLATLGVISPLISQAQSTNTPAATPAPAATSPEAVTNRVLVEAIPIEEQVLPTARPFNSVYGDDRSIIDTPRSVTIISREQLDAISIEDVRDFSKLTSSSYTRSNFGAPTTPDLRGQTADTYVNGIREGLTSNGNGLPVNFNSVESVNIVKGPDTAVFGPSQYVSGHIDLVTKRPYFDGFHGDLTGEFGSYDQRRWAADVGAPINSKLAWRFSYSGENSGSYYYDGFKKTEAGYGALSYIPNDKYDVFFNTEFFYAQYTENFGVNRPTQQLIDNGLYQTGINDNNGVGSTPSDPQNSKYVTSGFPVLNHINLGPLVQLDRRSRLLRPGDDSRGYSLNSQVIQTYHATPSVDIVNNSFFRYVDRDTYSSYYYSEIIDPSWSYEDRTEVRIKLDKHSINTGLDLRYQDVVAYNDFYNEPAAVWDLTKDHTYINYFNSINAPNPFTQVPVPGHPGRYYTPGNGDSGQSHTFFIAPFYQHTWNITDQISVLGGGRGDLVFLNYEDPSGSIPNDSTSVILPNANTSLVYKPIPKLSTYFTYNWSQNAAGAVGNGGGYTTSGNNGFLNSNLRTEAELYEFGAKYSLMDDHLFLGSAFFQQKRSDLQQDRTSRVITTSGIELESTYQPNRDFYTTVGYAYLDAEVNKAQFDVANTSLTPASAQSSSITGDHIRLQGTPEHSINFLTSYKFYKGFGVSTDLQFQSEIHNNTAGTIIIRPQYTLDVTLFYRSKSWDGKISFLNVTDEKNWSAPNAVYGNESIVADLPFNMEGKITYHF